MVLYVPDTALSGEKIWSLDDDSAPVLQSQTIDSSSVAYSPLAFCNDLEISADGNRIYFSEPFAYEGASMGGGTVPEAISFHGNGRIWHVGSFDELLPLITSKDTAISAASVRPA